MADKSVCTIEGCGNRGRLTRGLCSSHYHRWQRHGDPLAGRTPWGEPEQFFREIVLTYEGDDCLIWPYAKITSGYGTIGDQRVSRRLCEEVNGPPPSPDHEAAHSCGKGHLACVAKGHLSWKTHAENEADKLVHGTHNRGERQGAAKLTEAQVLEIRFLKGATPQSQIAEQFGISQQNISRIQSGKLWSWLK